jgi:hypothetical protein
LVRMHQGGEIGRSRISLIHRLADASRRSSVSEE